MRQLLRVHLNPGDAFMVADANLHESFLFEHAFGLPYALQFLFGNPHASGNSRGQAGGRGFVPVG